MKLLTARACAFLGGGWGYDEDDDGCVKQVEQNFYLRNSSFYSQHTENQLHELHSTFFAPLRAGIMSAEHTDRSKKSFKLLYAICGGE